MSDLPKNPPQGNLAFEITEQVAEALERRETMDAMGWSYASRDDWLADHRPNLLQAYATVPQVAQGATSARAGPPAAPLVGKRAGGAILPPRFLSRRQAAELAGIGTGTFDALIEAGFMPAAVAIPGHRRKVWDRHALDAAMSRLSGHDPAAAVAPPTALDEPNEWDEVLQ